jgi:SAM-dependent methyltransferase
MSRTDWLNSKKKNQLDAVDLALPSGPILKVRVAGPSSLNHSDLVPGVYEGGFKLWEGAVDLARLLAEEVIEAVATGEGASSCSSSSSLSPVSLVPLDSHFPRWLPGAPRPPSIHGARVLELGCGSALPSLVVAKATRRQGTGKRKVEGGGRRGPVSVTLCDFNADVLRTCSAANVAANFLERADHGSAAESGGGEKAFFRFFAGDWSNLREALDASGVLSSPSLPSSPSSSGFDLILAAEVTYSPESYKPRASSGDLGGPRRGEEALLWCRGQRRSFYGKRDSGREAARGEGGRGRGAPAEGRAAAHAGPVSNEGGEREREEEDCTKNNYTKKKKKENERKRKSSRKAQLSAALPPP